MSSASPAKEEHSVEEIIAHQDRIREEQAAFPLVGPMEDIVTSLVPELGYEELVRKARSLVQPPKLYRYIRRIRHDGSCFFRAASFLLFEQLLCSENGTVAPIFFDFLRSEIRPSLLATFGDFVDDFCDVAENTVQMIIRKTIVTVDSLVSRVTNPEIAEYIVCFFRFCISFWARTHEEDIAPYLIDTGRTVPEYCSQEVECVGRESDDIHISAFASMFHVRLRIEYLDSHAGRDSTNSINFGADQCSNQKNHFQFGPVTLLYRPGHYDILYQ